MRIAELAAAAEVGIETIRYYQRRHLLETPATSHGVMRRYGPADLARLRFVRRAQQLGFTLDEIAALLRLSSAHCDEVQSLARHKLQLIQVKITDLKRMESALEDTLRQCDARAPHHGCPIIETLADGLPVLGRAPRA